VPAPPARSDILPSFLANQRLNGSDLGEGIDWIILAHSE